MFLSLLSVRSFDRQSLTDAEFEVRERAVVVATNENINQTLL